MTAIDFPAHEPSGFSRRQALKIVAAAAAIPAGIAGYRLLGPSARFHTWDGAALGAVSSMMIWHSNSGYAERTISSMVAEVDRLERVFSLYRPDSELSRLNRDGRISGASRDLVTVMTAAQQVGLHSDGAFDPTVQPLWDAYLTYFARPHANAAGPGSAEIDAARRLVGYRNIDIASRRISFAVPGMSATLNGIAQGYITDYVADLLRNEGFAHVVVELGETRVIGDHPDGRPWRVGLRDQAGSTGRMIDLVDAAVAMSAGYGTPFDPSGNSHHIFDPATGLSAHSMHDVAVTGARAMEADALGTALFVAGEARAASILANYPGTHAIITRIDGSVVNI